MFSVIPLARSVFDSLNKTLRGKDEVTIVC